MKQITSNPAHRDKKQLVLENFGGVDFSSSPLNVAKNRASFACNLINDNGVNHKRHGWDEKYKLDGKINGMFEYKNGTYRALIVYAGKSFYHIHGVKTELLYDESFIDGKVQFFPHNDKVFIIGCGEYLVYGEFEGSYQIKRVADIAYVPTTSVNGKPEVFEDIYHNGTVPEDKYWSGYEKKSDAEVGDVLEEINIVTRKRKNTFIGVECGWYYDNYHVDVSRSMSKYYTDIAFTLDGAALKEQKYYTEVEVQRADGSSSLEEVEIIVKNGVGIGFTSQEDFRQNQDSETEGTFGNVVFEFEAIEATEGAIDASYITGCTFGTLFGAAGASDRLFLSGNSQYPNCDFYSEFDDYTYFTAQSQTVMGSDDVPITGYVRLSDNTLAVMKAGAVHEPSIYYRQATEAVTAEDDRVKKIAFTKWSGGTGEGCINPYTVASLAEDDLILSSNGVFGMVEVSNQRTNSRYMRERSRFINGKLLGEARLNEACAFVYKNRYYLAVPTPKWDERNGVCYVADPRHKTYRSDDIDGTFNYEWWYWENIPSRCFAVINGQLWFGTEDGRICAFDDRFCDRTYTRLIADEGDVTFAFADNKHTYSKDFELNEGDAVVISGELYTPYFDGSFATTDREIRVYNGISADIRYGDTVYIELKDIDSQDDFDTKYRPYTVDSIRNNGLYTSFKLFCNNMEFTDWNNLKGIYRRVSADTLYLKNVDAENHTFQLSEYSYEDAPVLKLANYYTRNIAAGMAVRHSKNICSDWHTPVFDLGATDMLKTVYSMAITIDPTVRGELKLVCETANDVRAFSAKEGANAFDFENFSFDDISFAQGFTSARVIKCKVRKFNYIMFKFISNNDGDCAVNNFKIIYTLNNRFKGYF